MAKEDYILKQTGEQVQKAIDDALALAPATVETPGLMSAADKEKLNGLPTGASLESSLGGKVDKVTGKGLSTNDYDNSEKSKVASAYQKPNTGIPKDDLSDGVKASLGNADSASQDVADIKTKIPSQASDQNQLADKNFVNSSIATATADFKGTYDSLSELQAVTADKNDYGYVVSTDQAGNTVYSRYKYDGSAWVFEYDLNNSSFTAAEWASIQSQITSALVQKLSALPTNQELSQSLSGKQDIIPDLSTIRSGAAAGATAYQKPGSGIPASDMASGVIPEDVVKYASQTLTDSQKTQARTNIGAASEEELDAISRGEYVEAWDGVSEPVVAEIPSGVQVEYNSQTYTGTLAASNDTLGKIYLVATGTSNEYNRYRTSRSGVEGSYTYSWVPFGSTQINLANYATKSEVSQLRHELGEELPLNLINRGEVSEWDGQSAVTNNFVSLIQGHTYKVAIKFQNSGTCAAADNVKLMTADSLSSVRTIIDLKNRSVTAGDVVSTDLSWSDASVENYRLGVFCGVFSTAIFNGAEISVRDTTAESAKIDAGTNSARLVPIAPIGLISTHETDKIAITDSTITIPKNTRIVYGLNGYSYTATQSSATVINRDSNYEQLIVFNIGTKAIVSRMVNAVQTNDVILFLVQNNPTNKRKISLHPSLYTYDGNSPFATDVEISKAMDGVRAESNASYPFKSGGVSSIPSTSTTYTAISGITLVKGHKYRVKLVAGTTFTAPSDFNLKIMTAGSDATLYRVFSMGGTTVSSLETDFVWDEPTAEDYRCGFFGNGVINVGISVYIEDITIDSGLSWDIIGRNKHKEASLVSAVSRRGNDAIKVADKLSLLHFSDVHGNTANVADVVEYMTHYADFLDDAIHTGDTVQVQYSNPNPFELVDGAEKILNVIGNHEAWLNTSDQDYYATEKQTYDKIFAPSIADWDVVQPTGAAENGYCYYYKDYSTAGFRLIVLDSVHWHYRNGVTDSNPTQKAWFESVLADARTNNLRVVCAMHYPPQNGIVPVANDTGWNAPILSDSGGLVGDGWYAADEIFGCVDAFITAGGKFYGWIMGHTHEDFFGKVLGHTEQPIVVIGTANGSGYIYDKFVTGTVAQDNFNIITFENLYSKDYIKIVKMGGDCDVLMRSKKTICYNVTDGILVSTT